MRTIGLQASSDNQVGRSRSDRKRCTMEGPRCKVSRLGRSVRCMSVEQVYPMYDRRSQSGALASEDMGRASGRLRGQATRYKMTQKLAHPCPLFLMLLGKLLGVRSGGRASGHQSGPLEARSNSNSTSSAGSSSCSWCGVQGWCSQLVVAASGTAGGMQTQSDSSDTSSVGNGSCSGCGIAAARQSGCFSCSPPCWVELV